MAGHSKWKNIQHRKGAQDARRGKIFTKMAKEIAVSAKIGGGDPTTNARLRLALTKARASNMPKDNIERAIKKGTGEGDSMNYTEKTYEGYGPGGVAFLVECLTDNVNRTVSDVRHAFSRHGGNLGTDGSVGWMFHSKGSIVYEKAAVGAGFDRLFELALENGAEDVREEDEVLQVLCAPSDFSALREALEKIAIEPLEAEIARIPETMSEVDGESLPSLRKLIDALEDSDDVQNVYHNAHLPEEE